MMNWESKIAGFGAAPRELIENVERTLGLVLPYDYKNFLLICNGGTPLHKYSTFNVKALNQEIPLDVLLGICVDKFDLQKRNNEYAEDLLPNSLIIGDDPGSGMIVLVNDTVLKGVYYWDHSFYFEGSSEDNNIYKIADSFETFINLLN